VEIWTDLRIVEVARLPGFHNPFKCARREVFDQSVRDGVATQRRPWQFWRSATDETARIWPDDVSERLRRAARDRFTAREVAECRRSITSPTG
jgi:hypothetical protein